MTFDEIQDLYKYLFSGQGETCPDFEIIKVKYNITIKSEKISVSKAIEFIKDVFEINFVYPDKLLRYARIFNLLGEEDKKQRNWKIYFTYENIFKLMEIPFFMFLKSKEKI